MGVEYESDRERFLGLLPFYANGTLGQSERAWMDRLAASDQGLRNAFENEVRFTALVRESIDALQPSMSADDALVNARKEWRKMHGKTAWWSPFASLHKRVLAVLSALAALSVAQAVYIATMMTSVALAPSRSLTPECRVEPQVRVTLRPDTKWEDAVLMMRRYGLVLRQGPNETGQVWLAVSTGQTAESAVVALATEKLVDMAEVSQSVQPPECKK